MCRYLLYLLLVFVIFFSSCNKKYENIEEAQPTKNLIILDDFYDIETSTANYNEHQYIIFYRSNGNASMMGVTHDPDCVNPKH